MNQEVKGLNEYIAVLRRRKKFFFWPAIVLLLISVAVAFALPPVYRSEAIILIEQQDIPADLVRSTITSYADQRIQIISHRVMTTSNLHKIIQKYDLYPDERKIQALEEVLASMREDISMQMISADVIDPRSGRPTKATIAFSLSYSSSSPSLAQKVANELLSLYLEENLRSRTRKTAETTGFLAEQANKLKKQISGLETNLADFKKKNIGQLPELMQFNLQLMQRSERDLLETTRSIGMLEERKIYLSSQLTQLQPNSALYTESGERILSTGSQLKTLKAQYVSLSAVYTDDHPDMIKIRKEISALEQEVGTTDSKRDLVLKLKQYRSQLHILSNKYSPEHPDVIRLLRKIDKITDRLNKPVEPVNAEFKIKPDNPAYIQMQSQLQAAELEINSLKAMKKALNDKIAMYEQRLIRMPQVEKIYHELNRDYENAVAKYRETKSKQMEAQFAEEMEKGRKGERFSVVEPPLLPEKPDKPNRIAIFFLGLIMSFAGGVGTVAVSESMDTRIYGPSDVAEAGGAYPLAVIPYIETQKEENSAVKKKWAVIGVMCGIVILGVVILHFAIKPLDVIWFVAMRKFGIQI